MLSLRKRLDSFADYVDFCYELEDLFPDLDVPCPRDFPAILKTSLLFAIEPAHELDAIPLALPDYHLKLLTPTQPEDSLRLPSDPRRRQTRPFSRFTAGARPGILRGSRDA